jgi:H/ACA ribonucleoprotein complex subunit 4
MADDKTLINGDASGEADSKKRKSKHEGETPEERAERKKRKKEKKEAKQ